MEQKIIIIKVDHDNEDIIKYLEESLELNKRREYYFSGDEDRDIAKGISGAKADVAFVIYQKKDDEENGEILKIYAGKGSWCESKDKEGVNTGEYISYKILNVIESRLVIDNFISTSELDLKEDFGEKTYINIENKVELINQIRFAVNEPFSSGVALEYHQEYRDIPDEAGLHEYSQKNKNCKRPLGIQRREDTRSEFQRDFERIVHSKSYRRLVDKAQIFTASKGDYYRTRMTHTLEVSQIACAIAKELKLNVELTRAIAHSHDLGHTPFGHQGERTLDDILKGKIVIDNFFPGKENTFGGFKHNFQGIRVVSYLEENYIQHEGLNLSYQVLEGILKHTGAIIKDCERCEKKKKQQCDMKCFDIQTFFPNGNLKYLYLDYWFPTTLEGQIVAIADEIAQRSHDMDDAFSAGLLKTEELINYMSLNKVNKFGKSLTIIKNTIKEYQGKNRMYINVEEVRRKRMVSHVIKFFVEDVVSESKMRMKEFEDKKDMEYSPEVKKLYEEEHRFGVQLIDFSEEGKQISSYLHKMISKKVLNYHGVIQFDSNANRIVKGLFQAYYANPRLLNKNTLRRMSIEMRKNTDDIIELNEGDSELVKEELDLIIGNLSGVAEDKKLIYVEKKKILVRTIVDYIAGMTDTYATREYNTIYL